MIRKPRSVSIDPEIWQEFLTGCRSRGMTASRRLEKLMLDQLSFWADDEARRQDQAKRDELRRQVEVKDDG